MEIHDRSLEIKFLFLVLWMSGERSTQMKLAADSSKINANQPRDVFQAFYCCSKYNSTSSIQLYDKVDRIEEDLAENIHIKYQIIKASSISAYSGKIRSENSSEKFFSLNCIIKTLINRCLENLFVIFCARDMNVCFCYRLKRKILHHFPQPFRIKQIKKSVQVLKQCTMEPIFQYRRYFGIYNHTVAASPRNGTPWQMKLIYSID